MLGYLRRSFEAEPESRPLFIPVFMGVGIAIYFALAFEPSLKLAFALASGTAALFFFPRENGVAVRGALFCTALGFLFATIRTATLDTYILSTQIRNAEITARVRDVELIDDTFRATLDKVHIAGERSHLNRIRIRFSYDVDIPQIGRWIYLEATLLPPFPPPSYGGFDFRRFSYFRGLSASGRAFDGWRPADADDLEILASRWERARFAFMNFRARINERILSQVDSPSAGVLLSMMTGDVRAVPPDIARNYRAAGIIHVISISGFHMSAVAALVFLLIRKLLALSLTISSRYNTKKLAVVATFFASLFYLMLSGMRIPATRAFIMLNLAMLAVAIDRRRLSMRSIAASAIIILALMPEALLNVGFQLSFLATAILIRMYEDFNKWKGKNKIDTAVRASVISSGIIGFAISPFIIYVFGSFEPYAILGNLVAMPIASIVVMPSIVGAFMAMPFGLDGIFLWSGALGLDVIGFLSAQIARLPGAIMYVPSMERWQFLFISAGLVWALIWRGSWKWLGAIPISIGMLFYLSARQERLFVDRFGSLFGVAQHGQLTIVNLSDFRPNRIVLESWRRRAGVVYVVEGGGRRDFGFVRFTARGVVIDGQFYGRSFFFDTLGGEWSGGRWRFVRDHVGERPWSQPRLARRFEN